jgi:hypothetical protein
MERAASQTARQPVADMWRRILSEIPTRFGQLVFISGLRDAGSGRYSHPAVAAVMDAEDTDRLLRNNHQRLFQQWLGFSLLEQQADLGEYLSAAGRPRHAIPYRHLVPPTARDVERQLYLTDLETLLELLRHGTGGAVSDPGA